jgi:FKBP-type peptidyl-prolyl cis-trans isomerase FklB
MKLALLTGLALGAAAVLRAADPAPAPATTTTNAVNSAEANALLKTDVDKFSYSLGLNWGNQMRSQSVDVTPDLILRGLRDGLSNAAPLMSPDQIQKVQEEMRKVIFAKRDAMMKEMKEKNLEAANKFLAENEKKPGIKKLEGGAPGAAAFSDVVQYKVIKEGAGPKPMASDRVAVHYRGTLLNGTEFDASSKRGPEPAVFGVSQVIKGWTRALTNMNVGSKWELYIPPALAYGENGQRNIEPNSLLIFEVELVEIKKPEPPPQPITSDIIKVPSKAELDAGAKIEVIKPEDLAKLTNKTAQPNPTAPSATTAPKPPSPK